MIKQSVDVESANWNNFGKHSVGIRILKYSNLQIFNNSNNSSNNSNFSEFFKKVC
jgi:hypothetical protein